MNSRNGLWAIVSPCSSGGRQGRYDPGRGMIPAVDLLLTKGRNTLSVSCRVGSDHAARRRVRRPGDHCAQRQKRPCDCPAGGDWCAEGDHRTAATCGQTAVGLGGHVTTARSVGSDRAINGGHRASYNRADAQRVRTTIPYGDRQRGMRCDYERSPRSRARKSR
jgi:hypothetical protein